MTGPQNDFGNDSAGSFEPYATIHLTSAMPLQHIRRQYTTDRAFECENDFETFKKAMPSYQVTIEYHTKKSGNT